jgi:hypothetical protein
MVVARDNDPEWPSPDLMPANPYRSRQGHSGTNELPAAYRGMAPKGSGSAQFGPRDADIAALKDRLELFREKIGRAPASRSKDSES